MIETVATLLLVLGLYLYIRRLRAKRHWVAGAVSVGLACGLAMLTKELMASGLAIFFFFALLYRRDHLKHAIVSAATALALYSVYPIWLFLSGYGPVYLSMKDAQLFRFLGRLLGQAPGQSSPAAPIVTGGQISFWDSASINLMPYAFSYIVIAAGAGIALLLLIRRRPQEDRLIAIWLVTFYGFIGLGVLMGNISDQFFYFLVVPAIVAVGYAIATMLEQLGQMWSIGRPHYQAPPFKYSGLAGVCMLWIVLVGLDWNISVYTQLYMFGQDNTYVRLTEYINTHIPPGTTLVFGNDLSNYILPRYQIRFDRNAETIRQYQVRYVILSTKEAWGRYVGVTPEFYDWVASHSDVRFEQYGNTYWDLRLFEIRPAEANTDEPSNTVR